VRDIQKMVRLCATHGIPVAARGQGHTVFGQSQVRNGLAIDMSTLDAIDEIASTHVVARAARSGRTCSR
jgi:FAD/FMN-containing dehydrogenase